MRKRNLSFLLLLVLTIMVFMHLDSFHDLFYGNLGVISTNKALSTDNAQTGSKLASAASYLQRATGGSGIRTNHIFMLGRIHLLLDDKEAAYKVWEKGDSQQTMVWQLLWGDRLRNQGKLDGALQWYEWAQQSASELADPWQRIGLILESQQKLDDAKIAFQTGLAKPAAHTVGSSDFYFRLAQLEAKSHEKRDWTTVLSYADQALAKDDFSASFAETQSHYLRGESFRHLGKHQEAIEEYKWVIDRRPDDYWSHIHYGKLLWLETGDFTRSQSLLEEAITLRPSSKWAYRTLADINLDLGNEDQATELYETVLKLDPQDDWSHAQLSLLNDEGT